MALSWMERAEMELEEDLATGAITYKEFNEGVRDIKSEYYQQQEERRRFYEDDEY